MLNVKKVKIYSTMSQDCEKIDKLSGIFLSASLAEEFTDAEGRDRNIYTGNFFFL